MARAALERIFERSDVRLLELAALDRLDRAGLLCTPERPRGVVVLPNLCRDNGFDLHLSNIDPDEANRLLDNELGALSAGTVHPRRLYW